MPRLDERLKAVARHIRSRVHADIGTDHAYLLQALLASGRIVFGIAVENKTLPYENSCSTLRDWPADVRRGEGLEPLKVGEADSLSVCGLGGQAMTRILAAHPDRLPAKIVLQPNRHPECTRLWACTSGFHLVHEEITTGRRPFFILCFERSDAPHDPAYQGLDVRAAILFGPHLMKHREPRFLSILEAERSYLRTLKGLTAASQDRLTVLEQVIGHG